VKLIEINLKIDEEVVHELETHLMVKAGCGSMYGTADEFLMKIIAAMRKGWGGVTIKSIPMSKRGVKKDGKG